ncbi:hypothetical protein [Pseudomonas sp. 39167]|uniref:hypothetical protein n=1 Tax=Pseudomonas sp. 39167 TaxID=2967215 RepID=UPI002363E483|nr:hypothetical protein [Pseudomonas sp. 39167]MDD2034573.1 hypothetical protein [Pseudomonas sp. 39167]
MELDNDKCDVNECVESTLAETHEEEHTGEHQDQVPQLNEATSAQASASKTPEVSAQPVILWRSLMLQQ